MFTSPIRTAISSRVKPSGKTIRSVGFAGAAGAVVGGGAAASPPPIARVTPHATTAIDAGRKQHAREHGDGCAGTAPAAAGPHVRAGARPFQVARQEVSCRQRVLVTPRALGGRALREAGREALVEGLDGQVDDRTQGGDEAVGLRGLLSVLARSA